MAWPCCKTARGFGLCSTLTAQLFCANTCACDSKLTPEECNDAAGAEYLSAIPVNYTGIFNAACDSDPTAACCDGYDPDRVGPPARRRLEHMESESVIVCGVNELDPAATVLRGWRPDASPPFLYPLGRLFKDETPLDLQEWSNLKPCNFSMGTSMSGFAESIAGSFEVSASYGAFSGAVEASAKSTVRSENKQYRIDQSCISVEKIVNPTTRFRGSDLREQVVADFESMEFDRFVEVYGMFYATSIELGGIFRYTAIQEVKSSDAMDAFRAAFNAEADLMATVSVSGSGQYDSSSSQFDSRTSITFSAAGGEISMFLGSDVRNAVAFQALRARWSESINDKNIFPVGFKLAPISDLMKEINATRGLALAVHLNTEWTRMKTELDTTDENRLYYVAPIVNPPPPPPSFPCLANRVVHLQEAGGGGSKLGMGYCWAKNGCQVLLGGNAAEIQWKFVRHNIDPNSFRLVNQAYGEHVGMADCWSVSGCRLTVGYLNTYENRVEAVTQVSADYANPQWYTIKIWDSLLGASKPKWATGNKHWIIAGLDGYKGKWDTSPACA